jgi:hypothetical protein
MVSLSLFPRLLAAQRIDIASLAGTDWYGLYLNGEKAGFSQNTLTVESDGAMSLVENAEFRISMAGARQDMQIYSKRMYDPDGGLRSIEYRVVDPAGPKAFQATVVGGELLLKSDIAGTSSEKRLPKPKESLADALKQVQLVGKNAKVGDELAFSVFEPMYEKELEGTSRIDAIEERVLDGVPTRVFRILSELPAMGINSCSSVTEDGTILEDVIGGIITMRIEPEAMAKDVNYSNDVIVSNAALVDTPVRNPRTRDTLRLRIEGPLTPEHLFSDERQTMRIVKDHVEFIGRLVSVHGITAAQIPITEPSVLAWVKPSMYIQSDDPKLVEKAREIVGDAKDAREISNRLCAWVHDNVRTAFSAQLTNALDVLERLEGDCTEYSTLFIGLARAAGLPAREVAGLIYMEGAQPGFYFHQWAKVWVGKWIDVDPTFNEVLADATHIKLAEGDLFEQARLIPVIGRIRVQVMDNEDGS